MSIIHGDVKRVAFGYDSAGNTCNQKTNKPIENLTNSGMSTDGKPYVFFMSTLYPKNALQICIEKCPNKKLTTEQDIVDFYNTEKIFQLDDFMTKTLNDLSLCWRELIGLTVIAVVIAFLMVVLMRFLAAVIVWVIVVLSVVGSIVGSVFLWWCFVVHLKAEEQEEFLVPLVGSSLKKKWTFLIFAIVASVLTVILLLMLLIMRKRISLVVALFHEAGKCLADVPMLLIQPIWTFLFCLVKFQKNTFEKQFWWIHLIGWIWTTEFTLACQEFVITSTVAIWYFTTTYDNINNNTTTNINDHTNNNINNTTTNINDHINNDNNDNNIINININDRCKGSENACARCCLKCCICCLWCLEKVLKFLHQNAYTIIAIEGTSFCTSARKAFEIISSNALRVLAINSVGDFVLFLGKVAVMCLTGVFAVLWLRTIPSINYLAVPVFLVCVFAFVIAHCFLSVYKMVVDALLICFCEDCQKNDGTPGREYFMSHSLMQFVTDSSAKISNTAGAVVGSGDATEGTVLKPALGP
ncbi:hypothetical protein HELRODRAFT_192732 [Helobdella robusta]|uniref:Choline transporter-like protein n=1 Tax=Helobdella robusta TaxID=6412 RepID=T1FU86_HELRO|nr:hypothetical protein HELRODRAFT_192732 [Helobdella robusta]ESO00101.1 hypothetical protein HELRODRAFT_192732 [Helobdella robusta]